MAAALMDWLSILVRVAHVMFGILWIGASFFFIWLDVSLRRRKDMRDEIAGESWMVHGGGFYLTEKFKVAPKKLPKELHWFIYDAYLTWLTGFILLAIVYYWQAEAFLIDKSVADLGPFDAIGISIATLVAGWVSYDLICRSPIGRNTALLSATVFVLITIAAYFYTHMFSGRAAYVHIGAFIGTIMAANVFLIIVPNQRVVVADLVAGRKPDARYGQIAKQRSLHNNYLTLPVLFMMISNHYPITFGHQYAWIIAMGVVIAGGLIRHFFNTWEGGTLDWTGKAAVPATALVILAMVAITTIQPSSDAGGEKVAFAQVYEVMQKHCVSCHSRTPTHEAFKKPPGGLMLDTPDQIKATVAKIRLQVVFSKTMPLGNLTKMSADERQLVGRWIAQGASLE
jgi:uncharacterized membrane protein